MSTETEILEIPETLEIPTASRRANLASAILSAALTGALTAGLLVSMILREEGVEESVWLYFLTALIGLAVAIPMFAFTRQKPKPGILRIEPDYIRWRSSVQGGGEVAVPYAELWVAHKVGRKSREILVFKPRERSKGLIAVGTAFLPEESRPDSILAEVHRRIALLPDGAQRLDGIRSRQAVAERISSGGRAVVLTVSALLVLIFLAELATGALSDPFLLWAFGANSLPLVLNGDLFRLATSNLLHGGFLHLAFNVMVLVNFGSFLEPLLGKGRFLTLLLISALAGAAGSAFLGFHPLALGASTGIAGLIGAYALILWRWPDRLATPPTRQTWLWMAFAFVGPTLFFPNIDHTAHLGGFLAGLVLMLLETRKADLLELAGRRRAWSSPPRS